ncbi:DmsE family decaheme c-type cytochrome [Aquabacterium humicola]|uniref:DmsE family decaheme c-type cytochrome n=1 Tax=Aquabacterium humicola TaxID=3237377 RepID=UPI002542D212|nr:DmsE family decaheme c-type cytochrome [Rubrivivax pictus]
MKPLHLLLALWLMAVGVGAHAADWTPHDTEYSKKGADTCLECHDTDSDTATYTTNGIFKSKHAQRGHAGTPFGKGGLQCEACHGPGGRHSASGSKKKLTTISFRPDSFLPVAERNAACLQCHQADRRSAWHDGPHARGDVACTDCHKLHTGNDPVKAKASQPEVCFACHKAQRADFHKASAHPVKAGKMACSDCHNAHADTSASALLNKPTTLQACQSCHADKRGPFLWEHAPVAEDCTQCHSAHGSPRPALLAKSPPLLCQQCHSVAGHPAVARTGAALPATSGGGTAGGASVFLLAGSCTNCHSRVHGSNHPAGSKLMR